MKTDIELHVDEVRKLVPRLLRECERSRTDRYEFEIDFERAKDFAWSQETTPVWTDIKERELAPITAARDTGAGRKIERHLSDHFRDLFDLLERSLPAEYLEAAEEIASDLIACVSARAHVGSHRFFDLLRGAYDLGGWPCGWVGPYPDGKMIVFCPNR